MLVGEEDKPSLEDLSHYGVLGMHWGVRREADNRIASFRNNFEMTKAYSSREITKKEYDSLPTKPIKLGNDFNRTVFNGANYLRDDLVYVTKTEGDRIRYMSMNGPTSKERTKREQIKVQTEKEAFSPGLKERIDTYSSIINTKVVDPSNGEKVSARDVFEHYDPYLSGLNNRELGLKTYQQFVQTQVFNTPIHSAYFEKLKKKGYTAVVDDADRGVMSELPIILFPKESGTKVTEVKKVRYKDVIAARARLENPDSTLTGKIGV